MKKTYIFGHKKPDSDSVMSAIALSFLKNQLGDNTEARVLGTINKESRYALNYFHIKPPKYLNDVKLQVKDVDYHKNYHIKETASIYDGYQYMLKKELTAIPITKENNIFSGLITLKDLSQILVNENIENLYTSYDNILRTLQALEVLRFDNEPAIQSKQFQQLLKDNNIYFQLTIANMHTSLALIDRVCRTIRDIAFN